jgi:hypothetical protein
VSFIVVEVRADFGWENETREYFWKTGLAITTARLRYRQDSRERRVATWPDGEQLWHTAAVPKIDAAALRRQVFGGENLTPLEYVAGPDGY